MKTRTNRRETSLALGVQNQYEDIAHIIRGINSSPTRSHWWMKKKKIIQSKKKKKNLNFGFQEP